MIVSMHRLIFSFCLTVLHLMQSTSIFISLFSKPGVADKVCLLCLLLSYHNCHFFANGLFASVNLPVSHLCPVCTGTPTGLRADSSLENFGIQQCTVQTFHSIFLIKINGM